MKQDYKKWAGFAGLCLVIVAAVLYTTRGKADWSFWTPMGLGFLGLGVYLGAYRREALEILVSRKTRHGANSAFLILMALASAAFVQAILSNHDISWDLSKGKTHTLSDEAVKAAKGLDHEIQAYAFFQLGEARAVQFEDLMKRVKAVNPGKFNYEFVDMNKKPMLATQYAVRSSGTTVLVGPNGRSETLAGVKEEDLVNALLKVSSAGSKSVYVLAGHGEKSILDTQPNGISELKRGLENSTFLVKELGLTQSPQVPDDCAALLLAGPQTDYLAPELALLDAYLGRGGRLIVAVDPRVRLNGLIAWLKKAGVNVGEDIVVDYNPINQLFGGSPIAPIVSAFD
ncbi:MAG: GldG family protein, partial [candidate division FCPU426 bacterium]